MARTAAFDRETVLERAMHAFWRRGYDGTSIHDLVAATGINRASMYNSFGSKQALFLAAVDHYVERVNAERLALLQGDGPAREALRRYFDSLIAFSVGEGRRLGCLLTNTAVELGPRDRDVERKLAGIFARVHSALEQLVRRGQAAGDIAPEKDPVALARFLLNTIHGLRVLARCQPDEAALRDVVAVALSVLDRSDPELTRRARRRNN